MSSVSEAGQLTFFREILIPFRHITVCASGGSGQMLPYLSHQSYNGILYPKAL